MQYFISFLEGIITFISPCLLPMLPIYISYFAGNTSNSGTEKSDKWKALRNSLGFVLGFTIVFILLGALAGTIGSFLTKYQTWVNIITGLIVVIFGLNFLGLININIFKGVRKNTATANMGFISSVIFGVIFSICWTPCVGAFLGSALMLASMQGHTTTGIIMLLCYSLGLGIPFIISALLIDKLKSTFNLIKQHYTIINTVCGIFLIIIGCLMATGILGKLLSLLS